MKKTLLICIGVLSLGLVGFSTLPKDSALNSINILDAYLRDYNITASGRTTLSGDYDNGFVFDTPAQTLSYNSATSSLSIAGGNSLTLPVPAARVFNNAVSRSLNSNFTVSNTREAQLTYSVALSVTNPLLVGSSSASAFLEYSTNAGSTWNTVSQAVNSSSVALSVSVQITQPNTFVLTGVVPVNALVRIRTVTSGTASATYATGQEVLL